MNCPFPGLAPCWGHGTTLTGLRPDGGALYSEYRKEDACSNAPSRSTDTPPSHELIRPLDGESRGLEAAPTEQNALRATRRLIARLKRDACGGVRPATAWHVLTAEDARILEEDTEAQREGDLVLFGRWHRGRGTDPEAALEDLRQRTESHALDLAAENGRGRTASPQSTKRPKPDPGKKG